MSWLGHKPTLNPCDGCGGTYLEIMVKCDNDGYYTEVHCMTCHVEYGVGEGETIDEMVRNSINEWNEGGD